MALILNKPVEMRPPLGAADHDMLGASAPNRARPYLSLWPSFAETSLVPLPGLAAECGVASLHIKDEGSRLGLGSFKALGGAYAVMRLVHRHAERRLGRSVGVSELLEPEIRALAGELTVGCATDGNHGRSVAAGARRMGCRSIIFLHGGVSPPRAAAIAAFADDIVRVPGTYDDSVDEALRVCEERGWLVVSDTSWPGYEEIPGIVAQGYTILADEALRQFAAAGAGMPTDVFLQAGVGGFAAAIACHLGERLRGHARNSSSSNRIAPRACSPVSSGARSSASTATSRRSWPCSNVTSPRSWRSVCCCPRPMRSRASPTTRRRQPCASSQTRVAAMRRSPPGRAALPGSQAFSPPCAIPRSATRLRLGPQSRVLAVNTETATDPASYEAIVGHPPSY